MANRQPRYVASESLPAERRAPPVDFREVVEASLQGVAILDHLQIRYVNPEFAGMFGYDTPDQLVGENWDRLVAIEDLPLVRARSEACRLGEPVDVNPLWQGI